MFAFLGFKSCKRVQVWIHVLLTGFEKWVMLEGNLVCRPCYLVIVCNIKITLLDTWISKFSFDSCRCRIEGVVWGGVCHPVTLNREVTEWLSPIKISCFKESVLTAGLSINTRMKIVVHMQVGLLLKTWSRLFSLAILWNILLKHFDAFTHVSFQICCERSKPPLR